MERNESYYDSGPKEPTARAIRWIKGANKGQLVLRYLVDRLGRRDYNHRQKSYNKNRNEQGRYL